MQRVVIPKPLSPGEECLDVHLRAHGIEFDREVVFAPPRKFRFDFVLRCPKRVAVEIDGGNWIRGRHNFGAAMEKDYEKLNLAVSMGYLVLRYTPAMVERGDAIRDIVACSGSPALHLPLHHALILCQRDRGTTPRWIGLNTLPAG